MPMREVCPETGAVLFTRTPEEQRIFELEKEVKELKKLVTASQKTTNQNNTKKK